MLPTDHPRPKPLTAGMAGPPRMPAHRVSAELIGQRISVTLSEADGYAHIEDSLAGIRVYGSEISFKFDHARTRSSWDEDGFIAIPYNAEVTVLHG